MQDSGFTISPMSVHKILNPEPTKLNPQTLNQQLEILVGALHAEDFDLVGQDLELLLIPDFRAQGCLALQRDIANPKSWKPDQG